MVEDLEDPRRQEPPFVLGGEREMLDAWLEYHRMTLLLKCEGLDDAAAQAAPGRHLASCRCTVSCGTWPRSSGTGSTACLLREPDTPPIWYDPAIEDSELVPLDDADWEADLAAWQAECDASRRAAAAHGARRHRRSGAASRARCAGSTCT